MNALSVRKRKNDLFKAVLLARTADFLKRSAMIYLLYGLYGELAKKELSTFPDDLPDNLSL